MSMSSTNTKKRQGGQWLYLITATSIGRLCSPSGSPVTSFQESYYWPCEMGKLIPEGIRNFTYLRLISQNIWQQLCGHGCKQKYLRMSLPSLLIQ